ncbi:hypothetical protein [Myceligenerans pegani]|uniref:DUF4352 domain-containing protein n=1 Tax=Myceligenerans pegani TaxID=2776917 RepID=A0ABR9MXI3_9MICO|nr:hypothetical protein [Myceligenerans sp. TRM 65318]MBE1875482.1 hypothetical protein [Myceligenerans sp. TRM 65318]MBE3017753.1 hypothetical protein [Myceligenerans sp. TRM 65318]
MSYRSILVVLATAVVVALVATWLVETRQAVTSGSGAHFGHGVDLSGCGPSAEDSVVYDRDEDILAVQMVRNRGRWPVEVASREPEKFRFGRLAEHQRDDLMFPDPRDGAPDDGETSDRVVIPPGREVTMWIADPFPDAPMEPGSFVGISTAPVMVSSLGVAQETEIELYHPIWMSGSRFDGDRLEAALDEVCAELR